MSVVNLIEFLLFILLFNGYLIIYFWFGIFYSIIAIRSYLNSYKLLHNNNFKNMLENDLLLLITFVLNLSLIISYSSMSSQFYYISIINNYRHFWFFPLYKLFFSGFFVYYLNTVLGTYYLLRNICLEKDIIVN